MDTSKINQTQLDFSSGKGLGIVNIRTGRMLFECPGFSIGANNYEIGVSLIYNSHYSQNDFEKSIGFGNGWKLNVEQYIFPYKEEYALEDFQLGDYVYVDSNWNIHRFIKYKDINTYVQIKEDYYDASGSGLRLLICPFSESEICDGSNYKIRFDKEGNISKIISYTNPDIEKRFIYQNGKLVSIYDARKSNRKILFTYFKDKLIGISQSSQNSIALKIEYKNNFLTKIIQTKETKEKGVMYFQYGTNELLEYAVESENNKCLKFNYIDENKIEKVIQGALKKETNIEENEQQMYVCKDIYVGQSIYSTKMNKKKKQEVLVLPQSYIKNCTTFVYNDIYTDVINSKEIRIRYYFNNKGFTTATFENCGYNNKTLFKTSGYELCNDGQSQYSINGKRAIAITNNQYLVPNVKTLNFASQFENYSNGEEKAQKYTENYVISFWIKSSQMLNQHIVAEAWMKQGNSGESNLGKSYLDLTPSNSWQYVCIPVFLGSEKDKINQFKIKFKNVQSNTILEIADVRIAASSNREVFIDDILVENINAFVFVENDVPQVVNQSADFYMTESDLFSTYKSMFYMMQNNQSSFDLVYCSGTKVKNVSSVSISYVMTPNNNLIIPLKVEEGKPNYYVRTKNKIHKDNHDYYHVIKVVTSFRKDNSKYFYKTTTESYMTNSDGEQNGGVTTLYDEYNENNTLYESKDEYDVYTKYTYDNYGNLEKKEVYVKGLFSTNEKLVTTYDFDDNLNARDREKPISHTQNDITIEYVYNSPEFTLNYSCLENLKTDYEYDEFDEQVLAIRQSNKNTNVEFVRNNITYDHNGRIKKISDNSNRTYGYIYNAFGEPTKYYENGKLIVEKEKNIYPDKDVIIDKVYNNRQIIDGQEVDLAYVTEIEIDKYNRLMKQKNNDKSVVYNYQSNIDESQCVSKISNIHDPYEMQYYYYHYDDENRPCGYESTGNSNLGAVRTLIRQIGQGDTQYYFQRENKYVMSKVVRDDSESNWRLKVFDPRITSTKYLDMETYSGDKTEENYKIFDYTYSYDELGRLKKKQSSKIKHKNGPLEWPNKIDFTKSISYKNGTTFPSKINYRARSTDIDSYDVAEFEYNNDYDSRGNIGSMLLSGQRFVENPVDDKHIDKVGLIQRLHSYDYDICNRLKQEKQFYDENLIETIEYEYASNSDKLKKVKRNNAIIKEFTYDKGKKVTYKAGNKISNIYYDNYGNIIKDNKGTITYDSRNMLDSYSCKPNNNYYSSSTYLQSYYHYNYQGVRFRKKMIKKNDSNISTEYVNYYLDGSKILGEDVLNSDGVLKESMRYFYDAEGVCGINYKGHNFHFAKDSLGNVSMLLYEGKIIGQYIYDAWGNCKIQELSIDYNDTDANQRDKYVLYNNPFRWKSQYLDVETGLYYVNGRYYSPDLMEYLNASAIENIDPLQVETLNRHAITLDNSISFEVNTDTIFTTNEMFSDPEYDPLREKTWWELNWKKAVQWIAFTVVLIVSIVLMCIPPTHGFGVGMFVAGLRAAISGFIFGGVIGGLISLVSGNSFMEGFVEGAIDGFINGFTTGAILYCASQAVSSIVKAVNNRCKIPGECFIAGTLVMTSIGSKPIEEIQVGDEVWAYDEETGEKALKKVVNLFRNTTKKWIHLLFEFENGNTEEIVCTEGHPFYVNNFGWIVADKLLENDEVLLYTNKKVTLINKEVEILETLEITYNFEVEDHHTYYVGENRILVHNQCSGSYEIEFDDGKKYIGKGKEKRMESSIKRIEKDYGVKAVDSHWDYAPTSSQGFIDEYNKMIKAGFDPKINGFRSANPQFYNKIWSPGKILSKIL